MNINKNLTPWFEGNVKPERIGAYETRDYEDDKSSGFQYWDGKKWGIFCWSVKQADKERRTTSQWQSPQWRGLAAEP